mmetsp:Transcript_57916/g.188317  ORF Transcript_57916/g.188317 Transcript_57916/m.188317 type:complete len:188 (-) Transcript_57916:66-629(-)
MRLLIPATAVLILPGVILDVFPQMWVLPIAVITLNYTGLTQVPLNRMVAGVAPPGRVGEALSAAGVSMQVAGFVANLFVVTVTPWVMQLPMKNPLFIFFPIAALLHLSSLYPVWGNPRRGRWGAASGLVEEQASADIYTAMAAVRWRNKMRKPIVQKSETEAAAMIQSCWRSSRSVAANTRKGLIAK